MNSRKHILDELKAINSELKENLNSLPYSVPQGYFENFADSVLRRVKTAEGHLDEISELSPLLAGLSRKMPFEVPAGYFSENDQNLTSLVKEEEESVVLSFISKEMPYDVPLGYFASFPDKVLEKVQEKKGRVVTMRSSKWMRMAAAAVIVGVVAISGIFYFNKNNGGSSGSEPIANQMKNVSTEELDAFLKNAAGVQSAATTNAATTEEVKQILNNVSDQELEAFLSEIPTEEVPLADEDEELLFN